MNVAWLNKVVIPLALLVALISVPFFAPNLYLLGTATTMLANVLLAVGLWLILSTGQVTLGHAGFAAIGGYISAALVTAYGFSWWVGLPAAVIAAAAVAAVVGYITLRITGVYFIVTTLALGEVTRIVFSTLDHPFGGLVGILNVPPPSPVSIRGLIEIDFGTKPALYYLTLVFALICIAAVYRLQASHVGLVFRGIMQAEMLAEHVGINTIWYKVLAFTVGSTCAGLAGSLLVISIGSITPTSFALSQSVFYLVYVAIGGSASIAGPIIGAVVISVLAELLRPVKEYEPIVFGALLIGATLYFRSGLWGLFQRAGDWMSAMLGGRERAARVEEMVKSNSGVTDGTNR